MRFPYLWIVPAGLLVASCTVKTDPLTTQANATFASDKLMRVTANQEPITGPVDLYQAMARALKYNLDTKVEIMQTVLKTREADLVTYSGLPKVVADAGYDGRSQADASTASTRDPDVRNADLTFSWNILDFGLSYVRAKQAADEAMIQDETKRRIVNKVIEDTRTAYWRAVSYDRLVGRMHALEGRVSRALKETRGLASGGESSPLVALTYERELIEVKREIELLEGELRDAKSQLAALMNVTPGTDFALAPPPRAPLKLSVPDDVHSMFRIAMENRPEMHEVAYRMRINEKDVDAAILDILPGINLYGGPNYDSNKFIDTNDWVSWGTKISLNLMKLATLPATEKKIDAEKDMLDTRSLSVAMAIMTQVNISKARYEHLRQSYQTATALSSVSRRIVNQVQAETNAEKTSEQILIREQMNALLADAKQDMAYADLQNAYANIYASLGVDPYPAGLSTKESVAEITYKLKTMWNQTDGPAKLQFAAAQ